MTTDQGVAMDSISQDQRRDAWPHLANLRRAQRRAAVHAAYPRTVQLWAIRVRQGEALEQADPQNAALLRALRGVR